MGLRQAVLAVAATASVAACTNEPQTGWAIVDVFDTAMIAVDLESVERTEDSVTLRAVSVFSEPLDVGGRSATHIVAELVYSCPPSTVLNRHEWRYADGEMFEDGPTGLPSESLSSPIHQSIARAACSDTIGKTGLPVHADIDGVIVDHGEYLEYQRNQRAPG